MCEEQKECDRLRAVLEWIEGCETHEGDKMNALARKALHSGNTLKERPTSDRDR